MCLAVSAWAGGPAAIGADCGIARLQRSQGEEIYAGIHLPKRPSRDEHLVPVLGQGAEPVHGIQAYRRVL